MHRLTVITTKLYAKKFPYALRALVPRVPRPLHALVPYMSRAIRALVLDLPPALCVLIPYVRLKNSYASLVLLPRSFHILVALMTLVLELFEFLQPGLKLIILMCRS